MDKTRIAELLRRLESNLAELKAALAGSHKKKVRASLVKKDVEDFLAAKCHRVAGRPLLFVEFYQRFLSWQQEHGRREWSKPDVIAALPTDLPFGVLHSNRRSIGNLCWEPLPPAAPFVLRNGKLKRLGS